MPPVTVHIDTPSVARVYDYFLGGKTNWEVDRSFADDVLDRFPVMRRIAFGHRLFLNRAVRHLLRRGVTQFLDVGAGVPSAGATHDVVDEWALHEGQRPVHRVVYVDNDPVAVAHTELFLDREGDRRRHAAVAADLRDPDELWHRALDTDLIDQSQPVALLLVGLLHLDQTDADGNEVGPVSVAKLRELLPLGSYAAISHVTADGVPPEVRSTLAGLKRLYDNSGGGRVTWRSRAEIEALLGDFRPLAPGWGPATTWRPEETGPTAPAISFPPANVGIIWAGVGKKA